MFAAGIAQTKSFYAVFFSLSWKSIRIYRNSDHLHTNVNSVTSAVFLLQKLQRIYILRAKQSLLRAPSLAFQTPREQTLVREHQELMAQRTTTGCTQQNPDTLYVACGTITYGITVVIALS